MMPTLSAAVFAWLCASVPLDTARMAAHDLETIEERRARYHAIADDIAAAVEREPSPRAAAALLTAIAIRESGLAKSVDAPECHPAIVRKGWCDSGRARSLWQLQGARPADRREAAAMALRAAKRSFAACRSLPLPERLAAYAAGTCTSTAGRRISRDRYALQQRLLSMRVKP